MPKVSTALLVQRCSGHGRMEVNILHLAGSCQLYPWISNFYPYPRQPCKGGVTHCKHWFWVKLLVALITFVSTFTNAVDNSRICTIAVGYSLDYERIMDVIDTIVSRCRRRRLVFSDNEVVIYARSKCVNATNVHRDLLMFTLTAHQLSAQNTVRQLHIVGTIGLQ